MTVSGIGKAAFHQVLSSFKVAFGGFGMGDLARSIQKCLILATMSLRPLAQVVQSLRRGDFEQVPFGVTYSQMRRWG
jgi:hypothetical protein